MRFTNTTVVGYAKANTLLPFLSWTEQFQQNYTTFQPISLVQGLNKTIIKSTTCHDYVQGAFNELYLYGAKFKQGQDAGVFRDAVLMFSDESPTVIDHTKLGGLLHILVYFRYFSYFVPAINKNFIHARAYLNEGHSHGVVMVLKSNGVYYRLPLVYPYIDYCYTQVYLPGKDADETDLTERFRYCKFTKAKFPGKELGREKISEPLQKAFSADLGWIRETLIVLIPAALQIGPQYADAAMGMAVSALGYGLLAGLALIVIGFIVAIGRISARVASFCGISPKVLTAMSVLFAVALSFLAAPLAVHLGAKEPNNIRAWGGHGPAGRSTDAPAPPMAGVYHFEETYGFISAIDFTFLEDFSWDQRTASVDLTGPALAVVEKPNDAVNEYGLPFPVDGRLMLRVMQMLRFRLHLSWDSEYAVMSPKLSFLGLGSIVNPDLAQRVVTSLFGIKLLDFKQQRIGSEDEARAWRWFGGLETRSGQKIPLNLFMSMNDRRVLINDEQYRPQEKFVAVGVQPKLTEEGQAGEDD